MLVGRREVDCSRRYLSGLSALHPAELDVVLTDELTENGTNWASIPQHSDFSYLLNLDGVTASSRHAFCLHSYAVLTLSSLYACNSKAAVSRTRGRGNCSCVDLAVLHMRVPGVDLIQLGCGFCKAM